MNIYTDLAIVVPVMHRPRAARGFMESLRRSVCGETPTVYAVTYGDDFGTGVAWGKAGAIPLVCPVGQNFPVKVQWAYEYLSQEWLLLVGDDVEFRPRWLDAACLHLWDDSTVGLIATNDLHNPYVLAGAHATHPIIRRSWVDGYGASWDGPGHIVHTGYHHAYVDDEWTAKAQQDRVFLYEPNCKIEHLHPTWTGRNTDTVYRLGMAKYTEDRLLFERRRREFG